MPRQFHVTTGISPHEKMEQELAEVLGLELELSLEQ
jgi:hypothetical protein